MDPKSDWPDLSHLIKKITITLKCDEDSIQSVYDHAKNIFCVEEVQNELNIPIHLKVESDRPICG
jgi:hypothetical protein